MVISVFFYTHFAMTNERTQDKVHCARQWYLAGKHLGRALAVTLIVTWKGIRKIAHFTLIPYLWVPSRWQRSPLSRTSAQVARVSVDAALVVFPIGMAVGMLW
jgi:hypothetical protein